MNPPLKGTIMSRHRKLNPIQMFIIKIKYRYALAKVGYKLSK